MQRNHPIAKIFLRGMAILILIASLSGCNQLLFPSPGTSGTGTPSPQVLSGTVTVILQDYKFNPDRLTVKVGTTVTWINRDPVFHSFRSDSDLFQSGLLAVGQPYSFTFDDPGTYPYYCLKNGGPGGEGMSGVIIVVP